MKFERMKDRCPDSTPQGKGILKGYKWIINERGVANILISKPDYVEGYIFSITESDERNLDEKEGVKKGCYVKETLTIETDGKSVDCLVYIDPVRDLGKARAYYLPLIEQGIIDSELSTKYVNDYIRKFIPDK